MMPLRNSAHIAVSKFLTGFVRGVEGAMRCAAVLGVVDAGAVSAITEAKSLGACVATQPLRAQPPKDPNADAFGFGPWYVNSDRTIWANAVQIQEGGAKVLWIRPQGAELRVFGRRLDGESPPLTAHIPCCYPTGFQATGLAFPSAGCWEIMATAGTSELTFVARIKATAKPQ